MAMSITDITDNIAINLDCKDTEFLSSVLVNRTKLSCILQSLFGIGSNILRVIMVLMIIAVSDVHLGEAGFQEQDRQFSNFLDSVQNSLLKEGGDLVLLGDIFDFWRGDSVVVLEKYSGIIEKLLNFPSNIDVHYIIGNHDYYLSEIPAYFNESPFSSFGRSLRIRDVNWFKFIHGYQMEVMTNPYTKDMNLYESLALRLSYHAGLTGQFASDLWQKLTSLTQLEEYVSSMMKLESGYMNSMMKNPSVRLKGEHKSEDRIGDFSKSKNREFMFGGKFDWLVYGHTHHPFIDKESRTINTGSWGRNKDPSKMCYLKIENGTPELIKWST